MQNKIVYFLRCVAKSMTHLASICPNCGYSKHSEVDRKYLFSKLQRCNNCKLQYRSPIDTEIESNAFYNLFYKEGMTTEYPPISELDPLIKTNFAGTDRDFSSFISFLARQGITPPARLLDFGCSWGYGSYQFAQAGFKTFSFEIGEDRRNYGIENLGVRHIDDMFDIKPGHPLAGTFDCFFSAHVLEHVPSPSKVIELAWHCLKPGGAFVAFTPNGCDAFRKHNPQGWSNMWGQVHPNYLDDVFYDKHFARSERQFLSRSGEDLMKQYELGFIARKDEAKGGF